MGQSRERCRIGGWWGALFLLAFTLASGGAWLSWRRGHPDPIEMRAPHRSDGAGARRDAFQDLSRSEEAAPGRGRGSAEDLLRLLIGNAQNYDLEPGTRRTWGDDAVIDCVAGGGSDAEGWFFRRIRFEKAASGGRLAWIEASLRREAGRPPEWWGCAHDLSLGEFRAVLRTVEAAASVQAVPREEIGWDPRFGPVQSLLVWDWLKVRGAPADFLEERRTPTLAVEEDWQRARITAVYRLAIAIAGDESRPCRALAPGDLASFRADYLAEAAPGDPWFHELHAVLFRALGDDEGLRDAERRLEEARK